MVAFGHGVIEQSVVAFEDKIEPVPHDPRSRESVI